MIRIEDEEDIEAYKEAKAELDDEFKEVEDATDELKTPATTVPLPEEQENNQDMVIEEDQLVNDQNTALKEQQMDSKNASGLSKDLRRNELIEWQTHPQLNAATKLAIQMFERQFSYDDYMREREEKEGKKSIEGEAGQSEKSDQEEAEDTGVKGWDRQWAERMFIETKQELAMHLADESD